MKDGVKEGAKEGVNEGCERLGIPLGPCTWIGQYVYELQASMPVSGVGCCVHAHSVANSSVAFTGRLS